MHRSHADACIHTTASGLHRKCPAHRYGDVRDERQRRAIAIVEKQRVEYQRLQEVVNKWENVAWGRAK